MTNNVIKLEYRREFFDIEEMKIGGRIVTVVTADGRIVSSEYKCGSRKAICVKEATCSHEAYSTLCEEIKNCIKTANREDFYVDDSSESLKVFCEFGLVLLMDRGLGNECIHIGDIMNGFLDNYLF